MRKVVLFAALACALAAGRLEAKPRLVVQVVVGGLRYDYLERFGERFGQTGFRQFMDEGVVLADSRYNFMQTLTPATLATITTGADPCTHGVVSTRWADNITGRPVGLIDDPDASGLDADAGMGRYSNRNLVAPTLGDRLAVESPESKVVTIAADPVSAIVMGGFGKDVYWVDPARFNWISSSAYMSSLPRWLTEYNKRRSATPYLDYKWQLVNSALRYRNTAFSVVEMTEDSRFRRIASAFNPRKEISRDYERILYTPAANSLVVDFAKQAIVHNNLGVDDDCDLLNVCFDATRYILERYGSGSLEFEDMLYRLDDDLADLVRFIHTQVGQREALIVLTGDHGTCDERQVPGREVEKFNPNLLRMLLTGYLTAQYGPGDWVADYCDRQVFLNRELMYMQSLDPAEVQDRAATFALQFRGVANAATASAMQKGYYGGDGVKMQNSFYPKRGGDLTINLMPGWIEDVEGKVSLSGSMYGYDTHVPLIFLGGGLGRATVKRSVDMKDLAPTLARIMEIDAPVAATGAPIGEIIEWLPPRGQE